MRLYDTARQAVVPFEPVRDVLMYTCGITPYDATHLGHAATFLAYDVLQRRLSDLGQPVTCVRNVTDVDDPLFAKARQLGVHYLDLAAGEEARFEADMEPSTCCPCRRATSLVGHPRHPRVHRHGLRPRAMPTRPAAGVYFDVSKFDPSACRPVHHRTDIEFARAAWWQRRRPAQARPARLRAVAALAARRAVLGHAVGSRPAGLAHRVQRARPAGLGTTIDLHGGGSDLIYPHHECERAQSEAATGEPFVQHWMHVAMVSMDGEKMSKSLGNLVFVDTLRNEWDPRAIRLGIIGHHYRASGSGTRADAAGAAALERLAGRREAEVQTATCCSRRCGIDWTTTSTRPGRSRPSTRRRREAGRRKGRRCCWLDLLGVLTRRFTQRSRAPPAAVTHRRTMTPWSRHKWCGRLPSGAPGGCWPVRPLALWTSTSRFERLPADGPAILAPTTSPSSTRCSSCCTVPREHQLRRQGRVHGLLEDEVPLPSDGHDPHRPFRRGCQGRRALDAAGDVLRRGELFGIFPGGHAQPRRATCTRAAPARHDSRSTVGVPIYPVGIVGTDRIQPPDAKLPKLAGACSITIGRPITRRATRRSPERHRARAR